MTAEARTRTLPCRSGPAHTKHAVSAVASAWNCLISSIALSSKLCEAEPTENGVAHALTPVPERNSTTLAGSVTRAL